MFICNSIDKASSTIKTKYVDMSNLTFTNIINNDLILNAIILVESNNRNVKGQTGDIGILQITPIFVNDVNRILGYKKYKLQDRWNRIKSIEMYYIAQKYYNPIYDFQNACFIHHNATLYKEQIRYLNQCKIKLMQLIITNCSPEHRALMFDYISSRTNINHKSIEIRTRKQIKDITITASSNVLDITLSPTLVNIPKKVSDLIKHLL
jgi:hypothetical protein